MLYKPTLFPQ